MRSQYPLKAIIPDDLFPLSVTIQAQSSREDEWGQLINEFTDLFTEDCLFTTGIRGAVGDQALHKDDREHERVRGHILINRLADVPYGSRAKIVFPEGHGDKTEYWRAIGSERRPMSDHTRCAIEVFDGVVRG